jgi:hypothetical protein
MLYLSPGADTQRTCDKMITRPRSPADCPRSSNRNETESFMEAAKAQKLGCRAIGKKKKKKYSTDVIVISTVSTGEGTINTLESPKPSPSKLLPNCHLWLSFNGIHAVWALIMHFSVWTFFIYFPLWFSKNSHAPSIIQNKFVFMFWGCV